MDTNDEQNNNSSHSTQDMLSALISSPESGMMSPDPDNISSDIMSFGALKNSIETNIEHDDDDETDDNESNDINIRVNIESIGPNKPSMNAPRPMMANNNGDNNGVNIHNQTNQHIHNHNIKTVQLIQLGSNSNTPHINTPLSNTITSNTITATTTTTQTATTPHINNEYTNTEYRNNEEEIEIDDHHEVYDVDNTDTKEMNNLIIDEEDIDDVMGRNMTIENTETKTTINTLSVSSAVNIENYHQRMKIVREYYPFPFKCRKYLWCIIITLIVVFSILTLIFGIQLDYNHYFENDFDIESLSLCKDPNINDIPKIEQIQYDLTQQYVEIKNENISNPTDLTIPWIFMTLIQIIIYIFIYQPIIIIITSIILHCKYKYKSSKLRKLRNKNGADFVQDVDNNFMNHKRDNYTNLISFFSA